MHSFERDPFVKTQERERALAPRRFFALSFARFNCSGRGPLALGLWFGLCAAVAALSALSAHWGRAQARFTNRAIVSEFGYVGYACLETLSAARTRLDEQRLAYADPAPYRAFLDGIRKSRGPAPQPPGPSAGRNVIYLQMESVDGVSVAATRNGEPVMPFLYSLSQRALAFRHVLDNASSGRTVDAEFLVLASQLPVPGKPVFPNYDLSAIPSLPRILGAAGYRTLSMHGNEGAFWSRADSHEQLGFQESYFFADLDQSDLLGWGVSDRSVLAQAALKIRDSERPVFAHLILLSNHHPYRHVAERLGRLKEGIVDNHIESLRYVDRSIEAFFEDLERYGLLERSLVAVFSDHDSGIRKPLRAAVETEVLDLGRDTAPLIVAGSSRPPRIVRKLAGLQDLPVFVLRELGLPVPRTFIGNSLDSRAPTATPEGKLLRLVEGRLEGRSAPIGLSSLSKMAILRPEKLEVGR